MNRRQIKGYVAGPLRGAYDENVAKADAVAFKLTQMGYFVFCPHKNSHGFTKRTDIDHDDYMKGCIAMLDCCEFLFMVEGWEQSGGAVEEHTHAELKGIPIFYSFDDLEQYEWTPAHVHTRTAANSFYRLGVANE